MLGIIVALLVVIIYVSLKWMYSYWQRHGIEGPTPVPIFGNMFQYVIGKKHFGEVYGQIYRSYPNAKYVGVYKMHEPALLIRDLDLVNEILVRNFSDFMQNDFAVNPKIDPLMAGNPFVKNGEAWKETRNQVSPLLTMLKVRQTAPNVAGTCQKLVAYINQNCGKDMEMKDLCFRFTMENVMSCALSLDAECFTNKDSEFFKRGIALFQPNILGNIAILFAPWLTKLLDIRIVSLETDNWLRSVVKKVMNNRDQNQEVRNDFFEGIRNFKKKEGQNEMSENEIMGHCLTFFAEGTETSSITLSYALYELATNPDVQKKVFKEIQEVHGDQLDIDKMQDLTYLDQVLNESMRLNPALFTMTKICQKETKLRPQYYNGENSVTIKPGTRVIIPIREIHYDPKYFENPNEFDPERFSRENFEKIPKMGFMPFGEGPRICLGKNFALFQVKYALAFIIANYHLYLSPKMTGPPEICKRAFMLHCASGLWVRFEKRK